MKPFISAMMILVFMITGIGIYTLWLNQTVETLEAEIVQIENHVTINDWPACQNSLSQLLDRWEKVKPRLEIFIHHNEIDEINRALYEVKGYCALKNSEEILVKAGVLQVMIDRMRENEQLVLKNIF